MYQTLHTPNDGFQKLIMEKVDAYLQLELERLTREAEAYIAFGYGMEELHIIEKKGSKRVAPMSIQDKADYRRLGFIK